MDNNLLQEIDESHIHQGRRDLKKIIYAINAGLLLYLYAGLAFADRYEICEPPECSGGGGFLSGLVGIILVGALITIMSGAQKVIFITSWLGVVALSFALGHNGFALFWSFIGFWPAFILTSWLSEKIEFSNSKKNQAADQNKQEKN